jgi:carboxypeptidase PM20D1
VAEVVGPDIELRVRTANEASPAPAAMDGAGWQALNAAIQSAWRDGGADGALTVAPYLVMGGTDLKHYEPVATDLYRFGFVPLAKEDFRRVHGIDERVPVEGYLGNIRFYYHLLRSAGGSGVTP